MLIAARLPKGTDVSFITEMIEVIIFYFNLPLIHLQSIQGFHHISGLHVAQAD